MFTHARRQRIFKRRMWRNRKQPPKAFFLGRFDSVLACVARRRQAEFAGMNSAPARSFAAAMAVAWLICALPSERPAFAGVRIGGREYVRLSDWAKANNLEMSWTRRDEALALTNPAWRLLFEVHSTEARINGVQVRLLFPLVPRDGSVFLSALDAESTFRPVLSPPHGQHNPKINSIVLDPGHGGKDPGNRVGSNQEKRYNLLLAQELRDQLKRAGWKVSLTRTTDTFVELPDRPELAQRRNADLFLSLHFNATETARNSVQGAEVYCLTPAGAPSTNSRGEGSGAGWFAGNRRNDRNMFLAYLLQQALTRNLGMEDRGVHRARFAVLRDASMPAALVEAGFMSHPKEGPKIFTAEYRRQIARAIVDGLTAYRKALQGES